MNNKTICIITATYPLNGYGGIFIKSQCKMLKRMGYSVTVLYARPKISSLFFFKSRKKEIDRLIDDSIEIYINDFYCFAYSYTVPFLKKSIKSSCDALINLYVKDKGEPPALIIGNFSYPAGIGAAFISKRYQIPLIMVEHLSLFLDYKRHFWINSTVKEVIRLSKKTVCVSQGLAEGLSKRLKIDNNFIVISNPIDDRFRYFERPKRDIFTFISVGSLRKIKNHDLLIKAFAKAFKNEEKVILNIIGAGEEKANLQSLINSLDLNNKVILLGAISQDKLPEYYKNSDCFVLLSKNETFGIAYREAMSTGLPVISSNNIGIKTDWEDDFGLIVDISSIENICEGLKSVFYDYSFDGKYISNRMKELYSFEAVGNRYKKIIDAEL